MHKTLLAALIVGASALSLPALAQVNLGGATRVGAGVKAGADLPGAMHAADRTGMRTTRVLQRVGQRAGHVAQRTVDSGGSINADAGANVDGSMSGGLANTTTGTNVDIGAGVNATNAAGNVGIPGQGVGGDVSDSAHSAILTSHRSAGSVGRAVRQTATGQSVGAGASVDAAATVHGH